MIFLLGNTTSLQYFDFQKVIVSKLDYMDFDYRDVFLDLSTYSCSHPEKQGPTISRLGSSAILGSRIACLKG